jgi:3-oxoacyl-(acyl-carrier-protein) synthase
VERLRPHGDGGLVGAPIANTRFAVVDRGFDPVPVGVPGELWIAGDGVARGYLGRPDLTAEKFTPDPFAAEPGARLYRTGDLVRWRPRGKLEFLGRTDHQVKVRGYRVELGEIEAALLRHPAVAAAVAMVREDDGEKRLVAYTAGAGEGPPAGELRRHLRELLPEYMVPTAFVALAAFPLTPSGTVDRKALPPPEETCGAASEAAYVPPRNELERTIAGIWRGMLKVDKVGVEDNFFDLGGHSLLLAQVHSRLASALGRDVADLTLLDLFRYPTVRSLAAWLTPGEQDEPSQRSGLSRAAVGRDSFYTEGAAVAIVGMSGRFPGADGVEQFWENLKAGVDSINFFSPEALGASGLPDALLADPGYMPARGVIAGSSELDAPFFGYSPREAELVDPQRWLFLECCWEALEDAGYEPARFPGDIGVFAGVGMNTYVLNLLADTDALDALGNFLAPRVSYKLGLKGRSISVQTACSTSLVAVHLACQSLLTGECDTALAGGVAVRFPQEVGYRWQEGMALPRDGRCRTFDAKASGFVAGNGAGVVVLRWLADALRDGDPIRAFIRGSAVNKDGTFKVGFTAPSVEGQAQVIAQELAVAGVEPGEIDYVEAHGTELGDPIEFAVLAQALGPQAPRGGCLIGSVKTNIGHLDAAVAGLIKATLVLQHHQVPPSLNFGQPNPKPRLKESPFRVATSLREWRDSPAPRRAAVSSLGIGGTNAHVVLEEAPPLAPESLGRPWQLLTPLARIERVLARAIEDLGRQEAPKVFYSGLLNSRHEGHLVTWLRRVTSGVGLRFWAERPEPLPQLVVTVEVSKSASSVRELNMYFCHSRVKNDREKGSRLPKIFVSPARGDNADSTWESLFENLYGDSLPSSADQSADLWGKRLARCLLAPAGRMPALPHFDLLRLTEILAELPGWRREGVPRSAWIQATASNCLLHWSEDSKEPRNSQKGIPWSADDRCGFFLNRALSYPDRHIEEHREGLSQLGGLTRALSLAWMLLYRTLTVLPMDWALPIRRSRAVNLFTLAEVVARAWGVEVRADSLDYMNAFLVKTKHRAVIYLRKQLDPRHQAWGVCHELAHLALGHNSHSSYGLDPRQLTPEEIVSFDRQEAAADAFASLWLHFFDGLADIGVAAGRSSRAAAASRRRRPTQAKGTMARRSRPEEEGPEPPGFSSLRNPELDSDRGLR